MEQSALTQNKLNLYHKLVKNFHIKTDCKSTTLILSHHAYVTSPQN